MPVYTVPGAPSEPVRPTPAVAASARIAPEDRDALARELQRELRRVGCYNGEISGAWTPSTRLAMQAFVERVNAALPVNKPDPVLLSLVQGHRELACSVACPEGQTATGSGACVPSAVLAKAAAETPPDAKSDADKPAAAAAAAGAAAALAVPAAAAKSEPNARAPATTRPPPASPSVRHSGPVPPEPMRKKRRPRRPAEGPPKVYKDLLKVLGLK